MGHFDTSTTDEETWKFSRRRRVCLSLTFELIRPCSSRLDNNTLQLLDFALRHGTTYPTLTELHYASRPTCHPLDRAEIGRKARRRSKRGTEGTQRRRDKTCRPHRLVRHFLQLSHDARCPQLCVPNLRSTTFPRREALYGDCCLQLGRLVD